MTRTSNATRSRKFANDFVELLRLRQEDWLKRRVFNSDERDANAVNCLLNE
jgi:hypothetical protein